jgi:isoquinoline 1-oxidoreductase beta subunit
MIQLTINGKPARFDGDPDMPLLWYLRDELALTGTKFGCGMGLCGACTVHVNGGQAHHHHRGAERRGRTSTAESLGGLQRAAMRILPERPDHAGRRHVEVEASSHGPGYRLQHGGQHLPLRDVSANPPGDQDGGGGASMTPTIENVSRRGFLGQIFSAGALVIAAPLAPKLKAAGNWQPSVYLGIEPDGTVKIVAHRSEMGTGCRTGLPMIVADELEADWTRVQVVQALGDAKYGSQNTDGSCSVRDFYDVLRAAGASARTMLENAAATKWGVPAEECHGQNHFVVHSKTDRKLAYGELVALASAAAAAEQGSIRLKTPDQFRYIGKDIPIVDLKPIVTGKAIFGIDAQMPGMVYAAIERPPVMGAALKSCDDAAAKQVKGVEQVVMLDLAKPPLGFKPLGGAAVIANNSWTALQGRKKLKVEWDLGEHAAYDSAAYKQAMLDTARKPGRVARELGDVDAEFTKGGNGVKIVEASYYTPMLAHAAMEPLAAVAEFKDGKVVTWTCTQNPQAVQETVARAVGIKKEDVVCHVTLLGGGFGAARTTFSSTISIPRPRCT